MRDAAAAVVDQQHDVIVVSEDARAVRFVWGFLLIMTLAGWWALNAFVEMTGENRIAGNVVGALMTAVLLGAWIYEARFPARLEISSDAIVQRRLGRTRTEAIQRTTGELAFEIRAVQLGRHTSASPVLTIPGEQGTEIGVMGYDRRRITQACEAVGWRFRQ